MNRPGTRRRRRRFAWPHSPVFSLSGHSQRRPARLRGRSRRLAIGICDCGFGIRSGGRWKYRAETRQTNPISSFLGPRITVATKNKANLYDRGLPIEDLRRSVRWMPGPGMSNEPNFADRLGHVAQTRRQTNPMCAKSRMKTDSVPGNGCGQARGDLCERDHSFPVLEPARAGRALPRIPRRFKRQRPPLRLGLPAEVRKISEGLWFFIAETTAAAHNGKFRSIARTMRSVNGTCTEWVDPTSEC